MPRGTLPFQYAEEKTTTGMTALSGLAAYLEMAEVAGLRESIRRHVRVREEGQGWTDVEVITSLILLNLAGGESVDDLRMLEADEGLCRLLRMSETHRMRRSEGAAQGKRWRKERTRSVPSPPAVFRYLGEFHDPSEEAEIRHLNQRSATQPRHFVFPVHRGGGSRGVGPRQPSPRLRPFEHLLNRQTADLGGRMGCRLDRQCGTVVRKLAEWFLSKRVPRNQESRDVKGGLNMSSLFDLTGKVSIVTGGNGGIGRAIAIGLAEHGSDIVIAARNETKTESVVKEILSMGRRCIGVRCDVLEREDIVKTVDTAANELGKLNILVNNAGIGQGGELPQDIASERWQNVIDVNLTSPFVFSQIAYPALVKAGGGKIINVGSGYSLKAAAGNAPYAASKAGLWNVTRSLALDWGKDNIQVNLIVPGWIVTEMTTVPLGDIKRRNKIISETPAGRVGEPEDLAGAAIFFASRASDFVTGKYIQADGGRNSGDMAWPQSPDQRG